MSFIKNHSRVLLVAVCCAAAGVGAGAIATAGAATGSSTPKASRAARLGPLRRFAARAVHGVVVVRTKTGFANVTFDRGKVDSVSGRQLTITEGTAKTAYKTVTVTVPVNGRVRDDRQKSTLSAVKPGQRVLVLQAPKQTFVIARTPHTTA